MIHGGNVDAQINLLLQLSSDRDVFALHLSLMISSVSMSKAECERVGSCSLDRPPSFSLSPSKYNFYVSPWRWAGAQMLFVPLPFLQAPLYIQSLTGSHPGDRRHSSNTPNSLHPHRRGRHPRPIIYFSCHPARPRWKHCPRVCLTRWLLEREGKPLLLLLKKSGTKGGASDGQKGG